jgi:flagellar motor protein MotB
VLAASPKLAAMSGQIRVDMTEDGLRIQIVDDRNRPMFDSGSALVKPYMRELLAELGKTLAEVPNRLTLEGHTDATPYSGGEGGYSNWELSSDRANASRRELIAGGLPHDRGLRGQGLGGSAQAAVVAERAQRIVQLAGQRADALMHAGAAVVAPIRGAIGIRRGAAAGGEGRGHGVMPPACARRSSAPSLPASPW